MRVSEAMAVAGIDAHGRRIEDGWIDATCPFCQTKQNLGAAQTRDHGQQTDYLCTICGRPFVVVGPAPGLMGGYRLGDNVINPLGGMEVQVPPAPAPGT